MNNYTGTTLDSKTRELEFVPDLEFWEHERVEAERGHRETLASHDAKISATQLETLPSRDGKVSATHRHEAGNPQLELHVSAGTDRDKIALARKREELLKPAAKESQKRKPKSVSAKLPKQTPVDTRKEAAKSAGVGERTTPPVAYLDDHLERASIMEFDGQADRPTAELAVVRGIWPGAWIHREGGVVTITRHGALLGSGPSFRQALRAALKGA